ncbi:MAG: hypothetical protein ACAI25_16790 [Planctomycetota bacterium]
MRERGLSRVDIAIVVVVIGLLAFLLMPAFLVAGRHKQPLTRCSNNLRQIGLAAIQYCDEKRFFPHLGDVKVLDGGRRSDTATRAIRSLVYFNYHDSPEHFVCDQGTAPDRAEKMTEAAKKDVRAFRWRGAEGLVTDPSPLVAPHANDLPLEQATDLSYGWTRRGYTVNTQSTNLLAGDKSRQLEDDAPAAAKAAHVGNMVGNHKDYMVVVQVDGSTSLLRATGDGLTTRSVAASAGPNAGFLGVLGDDPELGQ